VWIGGLTVVAAAVLGVVIGYHKMKGPGGDSTSAPEVPTAGAPIKVGVLHSLTETMAFHERPIIDTTQLAIDEVNRAGGVLGRKVEAIVEDGASDAEVFAQRARKLIEKDGVVAIFGCWSSGSRKRVEAVCAAHDRLLLYPDSYEGLEESRHVFYLGGAPNQVLLPVARWAYAEQRKRRFFLIGSQAVYSKGAHAILTDELKSLGASVVGDVYFPLGETSFAGVAGRIADSKPDFVLNTVSGQSNVALLQALRQGGVKPETTPTVWFNISEHELAYMGEKRMIGDYSAASYFQSVDSPANRAFVERFGERFGATRRINDAMQTAYHGVMLWKQAVEAAGSTETGPVRKALAVQKIEAPEGPMRIDGPTQHTWRMARIGQVVADRQFKVVWHSPEALQPKPFPPTRTQAQWETFLADLYRGWGDRWEEHAP
jgi:urea transport system substrate-binding protein